MLWCGAQILVVSNRGDQGRIVNFTCSTLASSSLADPDTRQQSLAHVRADVFFLSALAKLGATVVTYPLLLVKSRLMSAGKHTSSDRKYTGTVDAIERIYKTEGDPVLMRLEDIAMSSTVDHIRMTWTLPLCLLHSRFSKGMRTKTVQNLGHGLSRSN